MAKKSARKPAPSKAGKTKDPKASPDPPAKSVRNRIGPGTTRRPKTLPAMKIE